MKTQFRRNQSRKCLSIKGFHWAPFRVNGAKGAI